MRKMTTVLLGILFAAVFSPSGKVFAEENVSATGSSVESFKATEASLTSLPEESVPLGEEITDEEVIDADA